MMPGVVRPEQWEETCNCRWPMRKAMRARAMNRGLGGDSSRGAEG